MTNKACPKVQSFLGFLSFFSLVCKLHQRVSAGLYYFGHKTETYNGHTVIHTVRFISDDLYDQTIVVIKTQEIISNANSGPYHAFEVVGTVKS